MPGSGVVAAIFGLAMGGESMLGHAGQTTGLISFLIIGLLAGWIASKMMRGRSLGLAANLAVGVVGALVGGYLFQLCSQR